MFSKCIIKKDDVDKELRKFVEENKCIFQGKSIDCSNNPAMDLLNKFISKKDYMITLKNIDRSIPDIIKTVSEEKDIILSSPLAPPKPAFGRINIKNCIISKWLYREGDTVSSSTEIVHITNSDTGAIAALDLYSPGILVAIIKKEGNPVKVGEVIAKLRINKYLNNDVPMGEEFKGICSSIETCAHTPILPVICSLAKEYVEKQYSFCPDKFKECKDSTQGSLCYIHNDDCEVHPYCLSKEKCSDDICRKFVTNETDALFQNNIQRKEQFCKILKNDIYNCCNRLDKYSNLIGTVLDTCKRGYYRINSRSADDIYINFNQFVSDNWVAIFYHL